jgi:hypothetical protein
MMSSALPDGYDLVCQSAHGAVQRCRCCSAIRVRFGNLLLGLDATSFQTFCEAIATDRRGMMVRRRVARASAPRGRTARTLGATAPVEESIFTLDDSGLGFVLSRTEVEELDDLLHRACLLLALPVRSAATATRLPSHDMARGGHWHA